MPAPFDPDLASRLLAKAGVKVSAAELRARASPTGPRRSDVRLEARNNGPIGDRYSEGGSLCGGDDPEDLSVTNSRFTMSPPHIVSHHLGGAVITKVPPKANQPKSIDSIAHNLVGREMPPTPPVPPASTGSAILDTYLQLIAENSGGMLTISTEQAAAAAAHAAAAHHAKMAAMAGMNHHDMGHDMMDRESSDAEGDYSEDERDGGREGVKAE